MPASRRPLPLSDAQSPDPSGAGSGTSGANPSLVLGRVLGAFGIQGWIRIRPFTDNLDSLLDQDEWILRRADLSRAVRVEEAKAHGAFVLARLAALTDRGDAEALRGWDVTVSRDRLPEPAVGEYYWSDLIGLLVVNRSGLALGQVAGLIEAPAHDVLRVATGKDDENGGEQLIPFVEPIVCAVDVAARRITVDWEADY